MPVAESFFATLKNEEATRVYPSKAAAHAGIANYIHGFYNPIATPRHSALGNHSPDNHARTLRSRKTSTRCLASDLGGQVQTDPLAVPCVAG